MGRNEDWEILFFGGFIVGLLLGLLLAVGGAS